MLDSLATEKVEESRRLLGASTVDILVQVIADAVRVVEEVGFNCTHPDIRDLLTGTGQAAFDEATGHLHILSDLTRQALDRAPKNDAFWMPMSSFGVGGTAPYVHDDATGELAAATPDTIRRLAERVERTEAVSFSGRGVVLHERNREAIRILAGNTSKTLYVGVHTPEEIDLVEELHRTRGNLLVIWDVLQSPLHMSEHMAPVFLECLRRRVPVCLASMPMPAITAPFSMSGLLTLAFAEFLVGLVIAQTVSPGIISVCASFPTFTSIRNNYALDFGHKYHNVANMLMSHVARMLDLPACQSGCTTNERSPTDRAIRDACEGYALFRKYGCHMIRHAFGFTKDLTAFSFEKLDRVAEAYAGTEPGEAPAFRMPDYDPEAFDAIARNSSRANYMQDEHTLKNVGRRFVD